MTIELKNNIQEKACSPGEFKNALGNLNITDLRNYLKPAFDNICTK